MQSSQFPKNRGHIMKYLSVTVMFLFGVTIPACSGDLPVAQVLETQHQECCSTPEMAVRTFWGHSENGEFEKASGLIVSATMDELLWRDQSLKAGVPASVRTSKVSENGIGIADRNATHSQLAEQLKQNWARLIFDQKFRLTSVEVVSTDSNRAKLKLSLTKDTWAGTFSPIVMLKKVEGKWFIYSFSDPY